MTDGIEAGRRVVDRDSGQASVAVVLERASVAASSILVEDLGATVAELNPEHPDDADVATLAFADDLEAAIEDWALYQAPRLRTLVRERDVRTYHYPVPRLQLARDVDEAETYGAEEFL
jgi:hypothetical protein